MIPGKYNGIYNENVLDKNFVDILDPIVTRITIEKRRQESVLENLNEKYKKTNSVEFLGGIKTTEKAISLIETQAKNLAKLTSLITQLDNIQLENFNSFVNNINSSLNSIFQFGYGTKWGISEQEKNNLKIAVSNIVSNKKKNLETRDSYASKMRNSNIIKENFEAKNKESHNKNPLRVALSKFLYKKKNDDIMMANYNNPNRGR